MTYTYKIVSAKGFNTLERTDKDGLITWIPINESNSDYQRYLRWLENPDADEAQSL